MVAQPSDSGSAAATGDLRAFIAGDRQPWHGLASAQMAATRSASPRSTQPAHGRSSCTGAQQVTELSRSGAAVTFSLSATGSCTGQQQQFAGTDTVRGGKIVAATISQAG
jgi:hypothetical protein